MTDTDPLKRLYRHLRDHVTQGVAGDVMQMPPSWGEILTAVHEAAFPDGATVTSGEEAAARIQYAEGWDAGHAAGYADGAKAQREADVEWLRLMGWLSPARIGWLSPARRPLVTDDTPEPEPKPLTASEALMRAHMRADENSPESSILWAAHLYAKSKPKWFRDWRKCDDPVEALESAQIFAYDDDLTACLVLSAAKRVATDSPTLFGGEA